MIGFYAYDVGPANVLKLVAQATEKRGHKTIVFPPQVRGLALQRASEMYECRSVMVGLSAFQAQEECLLLTDLYLNYPPDLVAAIVLEDVPGSSMRPKARRFASTFDSVLIALPGVQKEVEQFGYRRVEYKGPPPHWGTSYNGMEEGEMLRSQFVKIGKNGEAALQPNDVFVFVPGSKNPDAVNAMLREAVSAGLSAIGSDHFVVGFRKHPGEKAEKPEEEEFFRKAFAEREEILKGLTQVNTDGLTNPQLVGASDITVFTGGPTESIVRAYRRGRMLYYTDDSNREAMRLQGNDGKWFVAELGAAHQVEAGEMAEGMRMLLDADGARAIRAKQEEYFPLPDTFDTAPVIVDYIEELAGHLQ